MEKTPSETENTLYTHKQEFDNKDNSELTAEQECHEEPTECSELRPTTTINEHEHHIIHLSVNLFDQTQTIHELGTDDRHAIQAVAALAEKELPRNKKKPLHAACELVKQHFQGSLTAENEILVAATWAFLQGKIKKKEFNSLELAPTTQREILTLAALIHIASGLNASKSNQTEIQQVSVENDRLWIVVEGPQAMVDVAAAQNKTRSWVKIGFPEIEVLESSEAKIRRLPMPEPQEKIGILSTDTLAEAGRKVMRFHFAQMLKNEPGTRLGDDIEALHDMRVATRRMRAAFEVFETAFEPGALKYYLKGLRATGRALGEVRDLDVFMEKASLYVGSLESDHQHDLDILLNTWRNERQSARLKMLSFLDSSEYGEFKQKFNIFLNTPGAGVQNKTANQITPSLVCELAPVLIYTRFSEVRAFDSHLSDATIEQLHALRIEFKKLRYTIEYFREVLGKTAQDVIADIKKIQDHLGDLNDAQVATQILRDFIDQWEPRLYNMPIEERPNLEPLVQYLAARHAERHQLIISFPETWKTIKRSRFRRNLAQAVSIL